MDKNLLNTLIVYILEGNPLGRDQFLEMITSLPPFPNKESIMDTLEQFIEQGREEATRDAVRNLIKQAVLTDEQIASAMNVTIDYVLKIRKDFKP